MGLVLRSSNLNAIVHTQAAMPRSRRSATLGALESHQRRSSTVPLLSRGPIDSISSFRRDRFDCEHRKFLGPHCGSCTFARHRSRVLMSWTEGEPSTICAMNSHLPCASWRRFRRPCTLLRQMAQLRRPAWRLDNGACKAAHVNGTVASVQALVRVARHLATFMRGGVCQRQAWLLDGQLSLLITPPCSPHAYPATGQGILGEHARGAG